MKTDDCILWTGYIAPNGYGRLRVNKKKTADLAHRYYWSKRHGPIPMDKQIDHICNVRACINLDHLRMVDNKQNHENLTGPNKNSSTGVRGVIRAGAGFEARVKHNYKTIYGGRYDTLEEAAKAVKELRNKLYTHNDRDRV